jgi:hypothetical protein
MLKPSFVCALVVLSGLLPAARARVAESLIDVDYNALISRADLTYDRPVERSEEGLPVGNGRMGSLVWTTPSSLRLQINRVDVFAVDHSTVSFPESDSDYASGCAYVDIHVVGAGEDVFADKEFRQHLSVYEGLLTVQGKGVTARVVAWPERDVMAVEVDDQRDRPDTINIDLRMLRFQMQRVTGRNYQLAQQHAVPFRKAEHTATSQLHVHNQDIVLTQVYEEKDYYNASAVAIGVLGRRARARVLNESTLQLSAAPGRGRFTILIASAASFDSTVDMVEHVTKELDVARPMGFDQLRASTANWWRDFWMRGFVYLHSKDGQADLVEANCTYFMYLMGSTSRGNYPPRFAGMLWRTTGDLNRWGSQYWWANTSAYYIDLMPCNRLDLMDPIFDMYFGMRDNCAIAARQQWGSQGIWIPEITWFNGPEPLPDDIAAELQDLMLLRKSYEERTDRFQWFAETKMRHNSTWNFQADGKWDHGHLVVPTKGKGIFGHCTHILASGPRIASVFWDRYLFTMDRNWLRERAYPMIKDTAEFYRHFPNFGKDGDGTYHLYHVNDNESGWNSSDTPLEIAAMYMIFPLAIRASEVLDVDAELRPIWQEIVEHLPPLVGRDADPQVRKQRLRTGFSRGGIHAAFVYGGPGTIEPVGPEAELKRPFLGFNALNSFIDSKGIGGAQIFRNRLRLREGPGAIDAEHIGGLTMGIHGSLLASAGPEAHSDPVLEVFKRWPKSWDAAFTLRARGAFVVSSAQQNGEVPFVEIRSEAGSACRLINPWRGMHVTVYRDGTKAETLIGNLLTFQTLKGEIIVIVPEGSEVSRIRIL